jgi:hypothetical protein
MTTKEIILHIAKRSGIILIIMGMVFGFWYLTYDPHKYCIGDDHRHTDGGLGLFIMLYMISIVATFVLVIETIAFYFTKKHKKGNINLFMILFIVLLVALVML